VKLPGEDKAKARPLAPEGAAIAADERETAEKTAFEMWEHALQENATRQIRTESTEKIERLKAQFLDKVRHFTELVETAHAQIEAQAKARAEVEAKLAQMTQAAEAKTEEGAQRTEESAQKAEDRGQKAEDRGQKTEDSTVLRTPSPVRRDPPPAPTEVPSQIVPPAEDKPQPEAPAVIEVVSSEVIPTPPLETGTCECCGATGIACARLTRIDSGQSLCPRCLTALRADVTRLDSDVPN
jgi:hypothetical protein